MNKALRETVKDYGKLFEATPDYIENPYALLDSYREGSHPIQIDEHAWICLDYYSIQDLLRDNRLGRGDMYRVKPFSEELSPVEIMRKNWLLYMDPPRHDHVKQFIKKALNTLYQYNIKDRIQAISDHLIDAIDFTGFDFLKEFAAPLPLLLIADLIGVPGEDRDKFKAWAYAVNQTLEPNCTPEQKKVGDNITLELVEYLRPFINSKSGENSNIIQLLKNTEIGGNKLTEDEVIYSTILLLISGHETTMSLIANGMFALLRNPEQYALVRNLKDAVTIQSMVEECVRFDAPVQFARRIALEGIEYKGSQIAKGDMVFFFFGAGNHDPEIFTKPHEFNIKRVNKHMAFGTGIHACIGAKMARTESNIAFTQMIHRAPVLRLADQDAYKWKQTLTLRGLKKLICQS
jgi:pimeloyl-[acyl-carrier protein] synthase